jgi:phenylalanyl-tRNA synthetase alpha subunit
MNSYGTNKPNPNSAPVKFDIYDSFSPLVDVKSCFDDLRVPIDHVSRRPSDTYYINEELVVNVHSIFHHQIRVNGLKFPLLNPGSPNSYLSTPDAVIATGRECIPVLG